MSDSSSPRRTARAMAAALTAGALALGLSACGTGQSWVEEGRDPWGNGQFVTVGPIQAQALTVVRGPEGSGTATLVGTFLNTGSEGDALVAASLSGQEGTIPSGRVDIPVGKTGVRVGYNSDQFVNFSGVEAEPATYVPVTLRFERSGETTVQMLVVPPTDYYEGITPSPMPSGSM